MSENEIKDLRRSILNYTSPKHHYEKPSFEEQRVLNKVQEAIRVESITMRNPEMNIAGVGPISWEIDAEIKSWRRKLKIIWMLLRYNRFTIHSSWCEMSE